MAESARSPAVERVFVAVGLGLAAAFATIGPLSDPDAWWNLRAGRRVLETGVFAGPDPWSRFSSHEFVLTEWLGSVLAAVLYAPFGPPAIVWMRSVGGLLIVTLLYLSARQRAPLLYAGMGALVGLLAFSGSISERPQTLGLVLLLVIVLLWRRAALAGRRPTLWLLPLAWAFACSHGYWTLGVAVGGATTLGMALERRPPAVVLQSAGLVAASIVLAGLTPVGPRLLLTPFRVHTAAAGLVGEWERASLSQPLVCIGLGMSLVVALAWWRTGTSWWRIAHLALALAMLVTYVRLTAPAAGLVAPLVAEAGFWLASGRRRARVRPDAPVAPADRSERRVLVGALLLVLVVATALAPTTSRELRHTPTALAPRIATIPAGATVLNDFDVSSWMLFTQPRLSLVIDTRMEVYDSSWMQAYASALRAAPGWEGFVRRTDATWAVLRTDRPLTAALRTQGWETMGSADGYVVLRRASS